MAGPPQPQAPLGSVRIWVHLVPHLLGEMTGVILVHGYDEDLKAMYYHGNKTKLCDILQEIPCVDGYSNGLILLFN